MTIALKRVQRVLTLPLTHIALLVAGSIFLLLLAFHGNIWFDESYSVGIASKSFAEIWRIGSCDVHPVLFYWALHVLYLAFGENVLVYRIFAVAGAIALAALGYTHLRRDLGPAPAVLFSFLCFFTPYIALMAVEIRMYSWATFFVTLCFVYAMRIERRLASASPLPDGSSSPAPRGARVVPVAWWAIFAVSGLASAYLHYFGAISAFAVNALFLAAMVRLIMRREVGGSVFAVYLCLAVAQVAAYLPWLAALLGQVGVVSNTYWANFVFPATLIELAAYPVLTSPLSFAIRGFYGTAAQVATVVGLVLLCVAILAGVVFVVLRRAGRGCPRIALRHTFSSSADDVRACLAGFAVYAVVLALGVAASVVMGSLILYYRYLFVAVGPLLVGLSVLLSRVKEPAVLFVAAGSLLWLSCINLVLFSHDAYSVENEEPLAYFQEAVAASRQENVVEGLDDSALVLSSDIGVEGVTAVLCQDIPQVYLDWQPGNWGVAYESYAPTLESVRTWGEALEGYEGRFVVLGQSSDGSTPRDVRDLAQMPGVDVVSEKTFYRPYERTYFTVAVMERDAPAL